MAIYWHSIIKKNANHRRVNIVGDQTSTQPSLCPFREYFLAPPLKFTKISKELDSAWGNRKTPGNLNRLQFIKIVLEERSNDFSLKQIWIRWRKTAFTSPRRELRILH